MTMLTVRPRAGLAREMNDLFDDFFRFPFARPRLNGDSDFAPRVDIKETKDDLALVFEIPGMSKDDIKVSVKDGVLSVSGKRETKTEKKDENYIHSEIFSGSFCRSFTLPDYVKSDTIKADYKNGMLEIKMDKLEEIKPKEIEVKVS